MSITWTIIASLAALAIGVAIGFAIRQFQLDRDKKNRQSEIERMLERANSKAREIELKARDESIKARDEAETESSRRRGEISRDEERLQKRRSELDRRNDNLEKRDQTLSKRQSALDRKLNELENKRAHIISELERVSSMTQEEAKTQLLEEVEHDARTDQLRIIRQIEEDAQIEGERRARELIADAIQRVASDHVSEITVSVVPLPSDDMKGRIIGRNGRNIRAFEQAAGVDVVVDDTPEAVTISCFDSVRREVARRAMEKVVLDGRIHPANIEKIVDKAKEEVDRVILEEGERASFDAGVPGLHPGQQLCSPANNIKQQFKPAVSKTVNGDWSSGNRKNISGRLYLNKLRRRGH